jgi:hypothetical protein
MSTNLTSNENTCHYIEQPPTSPPHPFFLLSIRHNNKYKSLFPFSKPKKEKEGREEKGKKIK